MVCYPMLSILAKACGDSGKGSPLYPNLRTIIFVLTCRDAGLIDLLAPLLQRAADTLNRSNRSVTLLIHGTTGASSDPSLC